MADDDKAPGTDGTDGGTGYRPGTGLALWLPIGVALGLSLGQLGGNLGLGVALGIAGGVAVGSGVDAGKRRETAGPEEA
ncbi:hypothetical protein [Streptomyces sp. NPDC045251]|uniref:hypothetical protein n=1 Tax=unclassified Streptomyces TaxID=2593676 RepID=UPI0033F27DE0